MNPAVRKTIRLANRVSAMLYRHTGGRVGGHGMGHLPVLLLTVPGRRSGRPHTAPVSYFDHEGGYLVIGTGMGGSRETPQWFRNLEAAGADRIRIGEQERDVRARVAGDAEREALWAMVAKRAPHFAKWEARTGRPFPIALLTTNPSAD